MREINRVLAVCSDFEQCDRVFAKTARIAQRKGSGVTVMFITSEPLFEMPFFNHDSAADAEKLRDALKQKIKAAGLENVALFVEEADIVDRVVLEAKRESDTLIVTHYMENISAEIVEKAMIPVLVLKEGDESYAQAVLALDAVMPERCLKFMHRFFEGVTIHLYQDFQFIPMPAVDPAVEPLDVGMSATVYTELMEAKREAFLSYCREHKLKGTFEIGESGIAEDTVAFVRKKDVDLLILAPLDPDTMLGDAVEDILDKTPVDTLICYEAREF